MSSLTQLPSPIAPSLNRDRFRSAQDLLRYSGVAPVKESSGQKSCVHWQASPKGGFPSVGNWRGGVAPSFSANVYRMGITNPQTLVLGRGALSNATAKGKTHQGAIRALAFKWIRIVFRCW